MTRRYIPQGQIIDLVSEPDADLLAYTIPGGVFADCLITRYKSRKALEAFCRDGSAHHAIVKTIVIRTMLTNRNVERAIG